MTLKRFFKKIYYRRYWIQDRTPKNYTWFSHDNKIVPIDHGESCSDTARVNNRKEMYLVLDALEDAGATVALVSQITTIFRKRHWVDYTYELTPNKKGN